MRQCVSWVVGPATPLPTACFRSMAHCAALTCVGGDSWLAVPTTHLQASCV